ncbi:hypothetical protein DFH27DRAFT_568276 [Peziza echinospora]|nr:hypothetical protein DFH27DRAFT_568276 [Peziza echinospora]
MRRRYSICWRSTSTSVLSALRSSSHSALSNFRSRCMSTSCAFLMTCALSAFLSTSALSAFLLTAAQSAFLLTSALSALLSTSSLLAITPLLAAPATHAYLIAVSLSNPHFAASLQTAPRGRALCAAASGTRRTGPPGGCVCGGCLDAPAGTCFLV